MGTERWIGVARSGSFLLGVGFMRATVLETGQNKNVEQVLTHSPPPLPTLRPGRLGGGPCR